MEILCKANISADVWEVTWNVLRTIQCWSYWRGGFNKPIASFIYAAFRYPL